MPSITAEEIFKEIEKLQRRSKEGMTVREIGEKLQLSTKTIRERIRIAQSKGLVEVCFRIEPTICGKMHKVPAYKFKRGKL